MGWAFVLNGGAEGPEIQKKRDTVFGVSLGSGPTIRVWCPVGLVGRLLVGQLSNLWLDKGRGAIHRASPFLITSLGFRQTVFHRSRLCL